MYVSANIPYTLYYRVVKNCGNNKVEAIVTTRTCPKFFGLPMPSWAGKDFTAVFFVSPTSVPITLA